MAILQISRIQHRRGLKENLPQLAAAELGWAIDTRELFIGNGPTSEGAPIEGNTQILTSATDILALYNQYTYKGLESGYIAQTGNSLANPVYRTLQNKLDDVINARDFGVNGDDTDQTAAFVRMMRQVYSQSSNLQSKKPVYLPSGIYNISGELFELYPYATIYGDGPEQTIINVTPAGEQASNREAARTVDSYNQTVPQTGTNGAVRPTGLHVSNLSIVALGNDANSENTNVLPTTVLRLHCLQNAVFDNVWFVGSRARGVLPTNPGQGDAAVKITATESFPVKNIWFNNCRFERASQGILVDTVYADNIVVTNSRFSETHNHIRLPQMQPVQGTLHIYYSHFANSYGTALDAAVTNNVISSFNTFVKAGEIPTSGAPFAPVIVFNGTNCASINDTFDKPSSTQRNLARVWSDVETNTNYVFTINGTSEHGKYTWTPGITVELTAQTTDIVSLPGDTATATIEYKAVRGMQLQSGTFTLSAIQGQFTHSNDFQSIGGSGTVVFTVHATPGETIVRAAGTDTTMSYRVTSFKPLIADEPIQDV